MEVKLVDKLPFEMIRRNILIKKESKTNPEYGSIPEKRPIQELINNGVIALNKPSGPTSHQVAEYTKNILKIKKAGHGGTLEL